MKKRTKMSNSAPSFMRQHLTFELCWVCVSEVLSFHWANRLQGSPCAWSAQLGPHSPAPSHTVSLPPSALPPHISPALSSHLHCSGPSHFATSAQIILSYLCLLSQPLLPIPDLTWDPISTSNSAGLVGHLSTSPGGP